MRRATCYIGDGDVKRALWTLMSRICTLDDVSLTESDPKSLAPSAHLPCSLWIHFEYLHCNENDNAFPQSRRHGFRNDWGEMMDRSACMQSVPYGLQTRLARQPGVSLAVGQRKPCCFKFCSQVQLATRMSTPVRMVRSTQQLRRPMPSPTCPEQHALTNMP